MSYDKNDNKFQFQGKHVELIKNIGTKNSKLI